MNATPPSSPHETRARHSVPTVSLGYLEHIAREKHLRGLKNTSANTLPIEWMALAEVEAVRHGVPKKFFRRPAIRERMGLLYGLGEPLWILVAELVAIARHPDARSL